MSELNQEAALLARLHELEATIERLKSESGEARPTVVDLPHVTRVTVVGRGDVMNGGGVLFERYNHWQGVQLHLQDDGRTLKVFPA